MTRWYGYEYEESDPYPDGEGEFFFYDISEEDVWKFTITSDKTISEYEVINNTIHENSWNLVFDSLDGPIKYNENIYGKMSHLLNWDMDCGFNVIDDNEIEIIVISNLYFNIYRCKRIQK